MHIRKDDNIEVIRGDDKGKRGRVLRVLRKEGRAMAAHLERQLS